MKTATLVTCVLFMVGICRAIDFPSAGGDLASPTDWGQAVPGETDAVVLPSSGTYTLGGDISFKTIAAGSGASDIVFDFTNGNHTVTLHGTTPREVLKPVAKDNGTAVFRGGVWKFNTPVGVAMASAKMQRANVVFTDGCMVTNASAFNVGFGSTFTCLAVTNGASVYASSFNLNEYGGSSNVLSITAGGAASVNGDIRSDAQDSADRVSGNGFLVSGAGSKLRQTKTGAGIKVGWICSENWLHVEDGGECSDAGTLVIGTSAKSVRNEVIVRNGGILSVGSLRFSSSNNRVVVSDAEFQATTSLDLGNSASVTGNVMRIAGSDSTFNFAKNMFGSGCGNTFELADGATWHLGGVNLALMGGASNNVLRVTGGAVLDNTLNPAGDMNFYIGNDNETKGGNTVEILDGANMKVERFFVRGVNNRVVVSNATLQASSTAGYGIWFGHGSNSSGNTLAVRGTTPRVELNECKLSNGSSIRFEIPAEGYADGYVPVTARVLNPVSTATEKFEIDCAAWAANPDAVRKLVLMRTTADITSANADWILTQNPGLPEGVRLKVTSNEVILQKRGGFILSFR